MGLCTAGLTARGTDWVAVEISTVTRAEGKVVYKVMDAPEIDALIAATDISTKDD